MFKKNPAYKRETPINSGILTNNPKKKLNLQSNFHTGKDERMLSIQILAQ